MTGVLFAGGRVTDYDSAKIAVESADVVVCADSGVLHAEKIGVVPDFWIGDLDSVDAKHNCSKFVKLPTEKDDTDTMSAARLLVREGVTSVRMFGCTGSRLDHTFANLFVLKFLLDNGVTATIEDENNKIFLLSKGAHKIENEGNKFLSLLPFCCEVKGLSIKGVKYQLSDFDLKDNFPIGVSNQITDDFCEINIKMGTLAVFLSKD